MIVQWLRSTILKKGESDCKSFESSVASNMERSLDTIILKRRIKMRRQRAM